MKIEIAAGSYFRCDNRVYRVVSDSDMGTRVDNVTDGYRGVYHPGVFAHMIDNGDMRRIDRPTDELIRGCEQAAQNLLDMTRMDGYARTARVVAGEAFLLAAVEDAYPNLDAKTIVEIWDDLHMTSIREAAEQAYAMACGEADATIADIPAGCVIEDDGRVWEVTGRDDSEIFGSVTVVCHSTAQKATLSPRYLAAGIAMSRIKIERW